MTRTERPSEGFASRSNKGFHIKFPNGWTISTQFGPGNYCGDYPSGNLLSLGDFHAPERERYWTSPDAEIWYWNDIDPCANPEDPEGWKSPHDLLALLNALAFAPTPVYWGA
jgi:hypothetical protein